MGNFFSDIAAPVVGGLAGYYFGGGNPMWTAAGAGGGRFLGGLSKGEETGGNIQNSLLAGGLGYGAASGANYFDVDKSLATADYPGYGAGAGYFSSSPGTTGGSAFFNPSGSISRGGGGFSSGGGSGGGWFSGGGNSSAIPYMMGAGVLSNLVTGGQKKKQEEEYNANLVNELAKSEWSPETRASFSKGLMGEYSDLIAGEKRRTGDTAADAGRGGGFYGNRMERGTEKAREALAKALSTTYQPRSTDISTALAKAKTGSLPASNGLFSGIESTAGMWPYLAMMQSQNRGY